VREGQREQHGGDEPAQPPQHLLGPEPGHVAVRPGLAQAPGHGGRATQPPLDQAGPVLEQRPEQSFKGRERGERRSGAVEQPGRGWLQPA
jgi:hypothetical protein